MAEEPPKRRLAAILAADVVGFSRLMGEDEAGTLAALKARRRDVLDPLVARHQGRIFKVTGDGVLFEFASAVNAVQCAVDLQQGMTTANAGHPKERHIVLRIGVNLGDVLVEGSDLYGDGVNIAARIEAIAEPGSVFVSGTAFDHIKGKVKFGFHDLGNKSLKNIAEPVRVYRADMRTEAAPNEKPPVATGRSLAALDAGKPSIVVLPFLNMSGEAEQDFFADGMTEDIITELSRFKELLVISRNTSFKYKGKEVNVAEVARTLQVQYVIEGSVRKVRDRVRVTVQMIDAETDRHVWAERFYRDLQDIFAIQDEVTSAVASTLAGRVEAATRDRAANKPTDNMAAYECVLAGKLLHHRSNRDDNARAIAFLDRAISLDPKYAHAHAWKACTLGQAWTYNWCADRDATWQQVGAELRIALSLDDNDSDVHRILAALAIAANDHDKATYHQQRALSLNPNDDLVVVQQGEILTWLGQPETGIEWIQKAMRLNPYHPERFWSHLGSAYFVARRYAEAIDSFRRINALDYTHHAFLAAANAQMGNSEAASNHVRDILKQAPDFTVAKYMTTMHYKQENDRQHHVEALVKAGLPA